MPDLGREVEETAGDLTEFGGVVAGLQREFLQGLHRRLLFQRV